MSRISETAHGALKICAGMLVPECSHPAHQYSRTSCAQLGDTGAAV